MTKNMRQNGVRLYSIPRVAGFAFTLGYQYGTPLGFFYKKCKIFNHLIPFSIRFATPRPDPRGKPSALFS
jgi:hypothetical protein